MDLSLQSINWSADNFKKHVTSINCTLEPAIQSGDTSERIPFLTVVSNWQLSKRVSADHNMDVHKDVHYREVKHRLYMRWTPSY